LTTQRYKCYDAEFYPAQEYSRAQLIEVPSAVVVRRAHKISSSTENQPRIRFSGSDSLEQTGTDQPLRFPQHHLTRQWPASTDTRHNRAIPPRSQIPQFHRALKSHNSTALSSHNSTALSSHPSRTHSSELSHNMATRRASIRERRLVCPVRNCGAANSPPKCLRTRLFADSQEIVHWEPLTSQRRKYTAII